MCDRKVPSPQTVALAVVMPFAVHWFPQYTCASQTPKSHFSNKTLLNFVLCSVSLAVPTRQVLANSPKMIRLPQVPEQVQVRWTAYPVTGSYNAYLCSLLVCNFCVRLDHSCTTDARYCPNNVVNSRRVYSGRWMTLTFADFLAGGITTRICLLSH